MGNLINALLGLVGFRPPNQTCKTSANPSSSALSHGIRICKDCKWCHTPIEGVYKCNHPKNLTIDIVSGNTDRKDEWCSVSRVGKSSLDNCGKDGGWYENLS